MIVAETVFVGPGRGPTFKVGSPRNSQHQDGHGFALPSGNEKKIGPVLGYLGYLFGDQILPR